MKILVTGFDPFGGDKINPALEAVKALPDTIEGAEIVKLEVPTVFHKSIDKTVEAMRREKPDVVVCVGQAGGRFAVTPERVAINIDDARIADNEGNQPLSVPIYPDGATGYFSLLPFKAMAQAIRDAGLPGEVSNTAGTFVCNHLMYGVLYHIHKDFPGVTGGFIHVPFIPEQVVARPNTPAMSLADIAAALTAAIGAVVLHKDDIDTVEGKEF